MGERLGGEVVRPPRWRQLDVAMQCAGMAAHGDALESLDHHGVADHGFLAQALDQVVGGTVLDPLAHDFLVEPWIVDRQRSEEHTSELQSLMRITYAVFCLKK